MPPREVAELLAARARATPTAIAAVDVAGPGLPQHHPRPRDALGEVAAGDRRRRARRTARSDALAGQRDQPRVRLGQPDRPAPHRRHPLGGGRRRARPDARGQRGRGDPRVLLQRPRRPDRPVRAVAAGGRARASRRRRTATPAPTSPTSPPGGRRRDPASLELPDDEAQERLPRERRRADVRRDQGSRCTSFGVDFDVYFHENDLHESGAVERAVAAAARAGPHLRGRRRGLAAHHRLRRRQGPGRGQERRRADLLRRPTSPTTSTSASAASTGCIIMLGADHHGYVGRLKAMAACVRRRPRHEPRGPDRAAGQPGQATASRCG